WRHIVRVVAHGHHGVGADGGGMLAHEVEGFLSRVLTELRVERDVAPEERLDPRAEVDDEIARAHRDAAHDAEVVRDAVTVEGESRGDPLGLDRHRASPQSMMATPSISMTQP